ncbi:MAG: hypothetical protein ABIG88_00595 [Patescibacteria group bacterium]|nr:hypothetical protein [Patescibacteria group bacterium]
MKTSIINKNKGIFWDYDIKNIDFDNSNSMIWFLSRKLNFGDLDGIKKKDLKKFLKHLHINSSLKELFTNFLKQDTREKIK